MQADLGPAGTGMGAKTLLLCKWDSFPSDGRSQRLSLEISVHTDQVHSNDLVFCFPSV